MYQRLPVAWSDMSGWFSGRSKDWCFKVFLKCDSKILDLLVLWDNNLPFLEVYAQLGRFMCLIYKSELSTYGGQRSSVVIVFESCCWGRESSTYHWFTRAHYIAMIWKRAIESHPSLPSPVAYGWELLAGEGIYTPIGCVNPQLLKQW